MVNVTLNTKSRSCIASSIFLGYEGENQANKLVFSFDDEFVDGSAQLNIKRGNDNGYVALIKVGETYELEVKSSLVSKIGDVTFQLQVSKSDGTIYKFDTFIMTVKDAIDSDIPLPEDYPTWQEAISTALAEMDNINISIDKVDTTTTVSVTDKKGVITEVEIHDGADGKDGKDGFSPIATVTQTDTGATISITDTNGTTIATVKNGKDGSSGILEETDPIYTAEKSTLALKSELPTKLSQLQNDSEFITKTVNNLTNYYAKTETYTKTEINNLIGGLGSLDLEIVQSLPAVGKENTFYLLAQNRETPDIYDEYLYINGWEKIGSTAVDLTNYYTKTEVDNLIPVVPTKVSELENDSGYLTEYTETDPTIPTHVKNITQENITNWNNKSEFSGSYNDLTDKPTIPSVEGLATTEQLTQGLATKQDTLTAGDNITIENGVISSTGGGSSIPVGNIISFMGTIAPDGYLTCDGAVLNIVDYPNLASHFETQFGSKNHFGGDGNTTFAVPDLRNEFLRGYHGGGDTQLSGEIGIHQEATKHVNLLLTTNAIVSYSPNANAIHYGANFDTTDGGANKTSFAVNASKSVADSTATFTARPTNVAVLYCIKY